MDRYQVTYNARTGALYFGERNELLDSQVTDRASAVRAIEARGMVVTAEWLPNLTGTGEQTWVARSYA